MSTSSNASMSSFSSDVSSPTSSCCLHRMPGGRVRSDESSLEDSDDLAGVEETDSHPNPPIVREMQPDRLPPNVKVLFQPRSGGILVITDHKELDIIPPRGAKHCK